MEIKDGKAIISFSNAPEGFSRMNGIEGFEVAGADKVFIRLWLRSTGISTSL
jgi:sialate O-acetylesterase